MKNSIRFISPWVHTTTRCNLRCGYCFVDKNGKDMEDSVYIKLKRKLCTLVSEDKLDHIKLRLAGGEPLLVYDKWITHMQDLLDKLGNKVSIEILTNLTMLPDGFLEFVERNESVGVNVSLDSLEHSKPFINKKSSSHVVLKNIARLTPVKDVFIMTVLTDDGCHLPAMAEYVINNGFKWEIQLNKFYEPNISVERINRNICKVVEKYTNSGVSIMGNLLFNFCDFRVSRVCEAGSKMFYIDTDGMLYNCQMQGDRSPICDIADDVLYNLSSNKVDKPFLSLCDGCDIRPYCHGDCPVNNDVRRREYFCDIMKNFFLVASDNVLGMRT